MVSDEFKPDVGKKQVLRHQADLEHGLRQVAAALGPNQKYADLSDFFQDFIHGFWDPYEEVCEDGNQRQKDLTAQIRTLEERLFKMLTPENRSLVEQYNDLLAQRNGEALDYAFLVGYQCAFRFLMMGLLPAAQTFLQKEEKP